MKFLTYDPKKNKHVLVGNIIGDALFKDVEAKHYMRVLDGYGIQEPAFQELLTKGINKIILCVLPTNEKYKSTIKDWLEHSKLADYGHGKQRFLSMKYMHKYNPLEPTKEQIAKEELREKTFKGVK